MLNPGENFWGIRVSSTKELVEGYVCVLLRCSACQKCEQATQNEVDLPIFQITHRLTRKYQERSSNTVWETVPHKTEGGGARNDKKRDKRKYARISMKTVACVGQFRLPPPTRPVRQTFSWLAASCRSRKVHNALIEYGVEYAKR